MPSSRGFVPDWPAVLTTAMLCLTVAVMHVVDQGGITKYAGSPWWLGWGYRAIEIGGAVTAVALLRTVSLFVEGTLMVAAPTTMIHLLLADRNTVEPHGVLGTDQQVAQRLAG